MMPKETKVKRIDVLFSDASAIPLSKANAAGHEEAVGLIQELLTCQGYKGMPDVRQKGFGKFGPKTEKVLKEFRIKHKLQKPKDPVEVNHLTLRKLVEEPAVSPRSSRAYLALVLDVEITGLMRVLSIVTLAEGAGKFAAFNANSDSNGLSYGIIQWAQKPTRLSEIVMAYNTAQPVLFKSIFGAKAVDMITHTRKTFGGVDKDTGLTTDKNFDLIKFPWKNRFQEAALKKEFQKVQVETARIDFTGIIANLRTYADRITSERGYAFMIDLVNQHGRTGAHNIYKAVVKPEMTDKDALKEMADKSVKIVEDRYKKRPQEKIATRQRRDLFRETSLFSDTDFNEA